MGATGLMVFLFIQNREAVRLPSTVLYLSTRDLILLRAGSSLLLG